MSEDLYKAYSLESYMSDPSQGPAQRLDHAQITLIRKLSRETTTSRRKADECLVQTVIVRKGNYNELQSLLMSKTKAVQTSTADLIYLR